MWPRESQVHTGLLAGLAVRERLPAEAVENPLTLLDLPKALSSGVRPGLLERLGASARVTVVSAPPGSGKTILLRSWIDGAALGDSAAWVLVGRDERDPRRFWLSVLEALRQTGPAAGLVRPTTVPDLDGWAIVEQLLKDLAPLAEPVWLVVDDVHELGSAEALRQLELLVLHAPPELRFVLATRHDLRLGLHRLRLEGELTEIRADDLRFSLAEARELFQAAGVQLSDSALGMLHKRTEGWAAGLRLAALSLSGHPDPGRFAAEFSGSERMVAEYLLAEVLDRQPEEVRRLLLRTSVLEQVNGDLADALTGGSGGERVLQELEEANAFVVSLDAPRSWFRYHRLFADLLQLELRRTAPGGVTALHKVAANWFADHGYPGEAIRHAQAAGEWGLAARLLAGHWPGLQLDGQAATAHELLAGFPAKARAANAELQVLPGIVRLLLARQRGDLPAVAEEVRRLWPAAEALEAARPGRGEELRALALISLGITEFWTARLEEAERHIDQGVALARRIGRPFLEFTGLAYRTAVAVALSPYALAAERGRQAVELARRHGWTDEPAAGVVYAALAAGLVWQGRFVEAEDWVQRAERTGRPEAEPAATMGIRYTRALLELARGRDQDVLAAVRAAERLAGLLAAPHYLLTRMRALQLHALVRLGELERAGRALAGLEEQERERGEVRIAVAALRLAQGDPHAATVALAPVLDESAPVPRQSWLVHAFVLEAIARDALGDPAAAERAVERALDQADPDGALGAFVIHPAPGLLERHARHRATHAPLIAEVLSLLSGGPGGPGGYGGTGSPPMRGGSRGVAPPGQ